MQYTARLLFDSATSPSVPGARALCGSERSLLYASGHWSIDMVVFEDGSGLQVVHGQILDVRGTTSGVSASVRLGTDGESVRTDRFGQFAVSAMASLESTALHAEGRGRDVICPMPPRHLEEVHA